jgi:hypothetical protein
VFGLLEERERLLADGVRGLDRDRVEVRRLERERCSTSEGLEPRTQEVAEDRREPLDRSLAGAELHRELAGRMVSVLRALQGDADDERRDHPCPQAGDFGAAVHPGQLVDAPGLELAHDRRGRRDRVEREGGWLIRHVRPHAARDAATGRGGLGQS